MSRPTVIRWRQRYAKAGITGLLKDAPRPGRKRRIGARKIEAVVNATLHKKRTRRTGACAPWRGSRG